ncbi:MAG: hypothetical protein ACXVXZ_13970 [Mycobacteriaceae bacterium]
MTAPTVTCAAGLTWCTRCDADRDGEYHRTTITVGEYLEVDVELLTDAEGRAEGLDAPGFQVRVHDEPPLTAAEACQVAADILEVVSRF